MKLFIPNKRVYMNNFKLFNKMLKIGLEYEKYAHQLIKMKFNKDVIFTCDNYKYDFITEDKIKYEVKFDKQASKTDNFFIEYSTYSLRDKKLSLSGISKSWAYYYILIHEKNNELYFSIISTKILRNLIKTNVFLCKKSCFNSDTNNYSNGYIFTIETIKANSKYNYSVDKELFFKDI